MNTTRTNMRTPFIILAVVLLAIAGWATYAAVNQQQSTTAHTLTEAHKTTEQPKAVNTINSKTDETVSTKTNDAVLKITEYGVEIPLADNPYQVAMQQDHIIISKALSTKCDADAAHPEGQLGYVTDEPLPLAGLTMGAKVTLHGKDYLFILPNGEGCGDVSEYRTEITNWFKQQFTQLQSIQ
ncbi:MAG TPA: hypothetical protein PKD19_04580 [Candidatus Saccharibacteria bacterium]|nr:hypothetical protein [Candidatus Saccharibacteria bacterium]HMR38783.1 hypothetical protein [Candidatus Saccharibacteria bacterium]